MNIWIAIDLTTFTARQEGFGLFLSGAKQLYVSLGSAPLRKIQELQYAEYTQAVEIDAETRTITFGRDYLGHYPLLFGISDRYLYLSDDLTRIKHALEAEDVRIQLSEEALALYFSMGYVPHGMSPYSKITNCESASLYRWHQGQVNKSSLFRAIEPDPTATVYDLGECLERQALRFSREGDKTDVWCSGGLDSSVMAYLFNSSGRRAEILTLGYGEEIHRLLGEGERGYAREVAHALNTPFRDIAYTTRKFESTHAQFCATHNMPVVDTCVTPKYALAESSRPLVITGEGSDNLFGGPKNNLMTYATAANPSISLGWLYALAHERFADRLENILRRGEELKSYVADYFSSELAKYPGTLSRKLFYMNLLLKASSMIFVQSYYPSRLNALSVRHPFASIPVYETAFRLNDEKKYKYPNGKLCLIDLYNRRLPETIINRKKSGTVLPLKHYLHHMSLKGFRFDALETTGYFNSDLLDRMTRPEAIETDPLLVYALVTLNFWLNLRGEMNHDERIPPEARHYNESRIGVGV